MKLSQNAKHAVFIGSLCSVSYLAVYNARNILSAVTPQMIEGGYTEAFIGQVSATYFIFYALGQLINGILGDRVKAKWMICVGLFGAGITNFVFSRIIVHPDAAIAVYAMTGFFLSMIYGPMTKVVSENTEPIYATRCSLGYTVASFFGTPSAGVLASYLAWQSVFTTSSVFLIGMSLVGFLFFSVFERRGIVKYAQYKPQKKGVQNIQVLFRRQIVKFSLLSILTGIVRTSVVFWLPTYIMQYLGFSSKDSSQIFTIASLVLTFTAFVAIFIYERLRRDMDRTILLVFTCAAVFFALVYFVSQPMLNIIFIVLAILSSNCAASMMWSRYCPSLYDTGMVSSVTGFLDFLSYVAAAAANMIFANAVADIGWRNLILTWLAMMVMGVILSLPYGKIKARFATGSKKGA